MLRYFKDKSLLSLLLLLALMTIISDYPNAQRMGLFESFFWYSASILHAIAALAILRYFTCGQTKTKNDEIKKIGLFGYLWRYLVTLFSGIFFYAILATIIPVFSIYPIMIVMITALFSAFSFFYFCKEKQKEILKIKMFMIGFRI